MFLLVVALLSRCREIPSLSDYSITENLQDDTTVNPSQHIIQGDAHAAVDPLVDDPDGIGLEDVEKTEDEKTQQPDQGVVRCTNQGDEHAEGLTTNGKGYDFKMTTVRPEPVEGALF